MSQWVRPHLAGLTASWQEVCNESLWNQNIFSTEQRRSSGKRIYTETDRRCDPSANRRLQLVYILVLRRGLQWNVNAGILPYIVGVPQRGVCFDCDIVCRTPRNGVFVDGIHMQHNLIDCGCYGCRWRIHQRIQIAGLKIWHTDGSGEIFRQCTLSPTNGSFSLSLPRVTHVCEVDTIVV